LYLPTVTPLDWGILAFTAALAIWGYQQGLIVGALTLAGFAAGALLGGRVGPLVLSEGSQSPYAPLFAALGALMLGAIAAVALEGIALAIRARIVRGVFMHYADGAGGAILVAAAALGLAWVFGAVALNAPGATELRRDVQRSLILRSLNDVLPPSGPLINALNRVDPVPRIAGPMTTVGPPDPAIVSDPEVAAAGDSVVRVQGTACGLSVEGSGWVAAPGLVVTNAHVVAGQDDTTVSTRSGTEVDATPVHYEPANDLAILLVDLDAAPLSFDPEPRGGERAAVLGYPENGPFTAIPARYGDSTTVISQDSYGRGPIEREIVSLRGAVRSGNSGGPLIDASGQVLGTVFAATSSGRPGGFAVPDDVVSRALSEVDQEVGSGPCAR
jgi:S1-C subfamily serine protease